MTARTVDAFEPRVVAEFSEARAVSGWATVAGMTPRGGRIRAVLMPVMPSAYAETPVCLVVERQSFDAMGVPAWTAVAREDEAYERGVDAALTAVLIELTALQREKAAASTPPASAENLHPPDLTMTDDVQAIALVASEIGDIGRDVVEAGLLICPATWDADRARTEVAIRDWRRVDGALFVYAPAGEDKVAEWAQRAVTFFYAIDATPDAMVRAIAMCRAELGDRFQIADLPDEDPAPPEAP